MIGQRALQLLRAWRARMSQSKIRQAVSGVCSVQITQNEIIFVVNRRPSQLQIDECILEHRDQNLSLADNLATIAKQHHLTGMECSLVLSPREYQLFLLDSPPVPKAEFQAAIRWKILSLIDFPVEEAVVDHFSIPMQKTHDPHEMIITAVTRLERLQAYKRTLQQAEFQLNAITIQEMGLRNILSIFDNDLKSTAFIYLQDNSSEILVMNNRILHFQRDLKIHLGEVHSLRDFTEDSTSPILDELALDIQRSLDYFQAQWRKPLPSRIFLIITNEAVPAEAIKNYLAKRLAIGINAFDLSSVVSFQTGVTPQFIYQHLAVIGNTLPMQECAAPNNTPAIPLKVTLQEEAEHATTD